MKLRLSLMVALALLSVITSAQRYLPEFANEEAQKLFDRAEKAYVNGNFARSAKVYEELMEEHGETYELQFNRLTSLVHTFDTVAIETTFQKLIASPFLDCNFLSLNEDFKQIKFRKTFNLWKSAILKCTEKQEMALSQSPVELPEVRTQLLWMKYQNVQSDIMVTHKIKYKAYPELTYDSLKNLRADLYRQHFEQLLVFVEKHGWLGKSLVGEDGAEAAWLIAQHGTHAPIEQVKLLPKLLTAATQGEAKMSHYAHLFDLICTHNRRPQRYGTMRWENPETGNWELYPLEDSTGVNDFRKEVGLEPLNGF